MKICRFNHDRIGIVEGDFILDVSSALAELPKASWPFPAGDLLISRLADLLPLLAQKKEDAAAFPISEVRLESPVANPTKLINAPINYRAHIEETKADQQISHGRDMTKSIWHWGLFLKANSALSGAGNPIRLRYPGRRTDHEIELAVIIGTECEGVARKDALNYVAGYTIGLDITIRGPELQSFRKSADGFAVLGPWMVTADEINDPGQLDLELKVNGELRQKANTRSLVYDVPRLIEYASSMYTLYPGDVIFTGTPEGVGPITPGDHIEAQISRIGTMKASVHPEILPLPQHDPVLDEAKAQKV